MPRQLAASQMSIKTASVDRACQVSHASVEMLAIDLPSPQNTTLTSPTIRKISISSLKSARRHLWVGSRFIQVPTRVAYGS